MIELIDNISIGLFVLMVLAGFSFMYQHIYVTDPKTRKTNEYKKAVQKSPDSFPETGSYVDFNTGIVLTHLAWLLIQKQNKTQQDKRYIFFTLLGIISALAFISGIILLFNIKA